LFASARTGVGLDLLRQALESAAKQSGCERFDRKVDGTSGGDTLVPDETLDTDAPPPAEQHLSNGTPDVDPNSRIDVAQ
jgi:hypothetical protein